MKLKYNSLLILLFVLGIPEGRAQDYPHDVAQYPFINYKLNKLEFYGDSARWKDIFYKFDSIVFDGSGHIDILHMGGSHIQAGVFSSQMRQHLQTIRPGLQSYRGFLFPYALAGTNNPRNYHVRYSGSWEGCRNVEKSRNCELGISGLSATTRSPNASLTIKFSAEFNESTFSTLKVFHPMDSSQFEIMPSDPRHTHRYDSAGGFSLFEFQLPQDSLHLKFVRKNPSQDQFTLYGLQFSNQFSGFAYHAIGVNGADVPAYLRCELLPDQAAVIKPDIVIFSIGINDAHTAYFRSEFFKENYEKLIAIFKSINPEIRILFTTNNDSYYRRRNANPNGEKVSQAMKELAQRHDAAVWDLYSIMGGLDSIKEWENYGLAQRDKIHFTRDGYELVGDLFFSALIKSYEAHIKSVDSP